MDNRLTKITTETGDLGSTGLADGSRRLKNDPRISCLGEVDELNSMIGLIRSLLEGPQSQQLLNQIQHDLLDLGAELSQPGKNLLTGVYVDFLDEHLHRMNTDLPALKEFILPGGSPLLAQIHLARTVCRRVERSLVELHQLETQNPLSLKYLNRLSDVFFILARFIAKRGGHKEIYWQSQYSRIKPL